MIVKGTWGADVRGLGSSQRWRMHRTYFGQAAEGAAVAAGDAASPSPWHPVAIGVTAGLIVYVTTRVLDRVFPRG